MKKIKYYLIRIFKGRRPAIDYALKMQMKTLKDSPTAWIWWHNKIL
tara:strand:+ start:473 stop:610 length:138 start_codon:yes stop_codon:yes gene_type:complete